MKMQGICFGVGDGWGDAAVWAARRMERVTGLDCRVIFEAPGGFMAATRHPSWWKCRVWDLVPDDVEAVVVFDADVVAVEALTLAELSAAVAAQPLVGALDVNSRGVLSECAAYGLDPAAYINCGFMVAARGSKELLERAWARGPHYGSWMEQTAINMELAVAGFGAAWPRGWQFLREANLGAIDWPAMQEDPRMTVARVVHVTGLGKQLAVLADLHRQIDGVQP